MSRKYPQPSSLPTFPQADLYLCRGAGCEEMLSWMTDWTISGWGSGYCGACYRKLEKIQWISRYER